MIISASYKTDIPTFYGEWFMNRLRDGFCKMVNPYGRQVYTVNLRKEPDAEGREGVDGIVFWTKNVGPFMKYLPEMADRGYKFAVQHTINGYPRQLEARVVDYDQTVRHMHELAEFAAKHEMHPPIWRYDPIVFTDLTSTDWHKGNFEKLARQLEGATDEVVVSFAQIYRKTRRNMDEAASAEGFSWSEHEKIAGTNILPDDRAIDLLTFLADVANTSSIELRICSQERYLVPGIIEEAHCIDADWFGGTYKRHGNRKECACSASRDIGEYDTCPHGCVYCYAVQNRAKALNRYKRHDPNSPFLFEPGFPVNEVELKQKQATTKSSSERSLAEEQRKELPMLSKPTLPFD